MYQKGRCTYLMIGIICGVIAIAIVILLSFSVRQKEYVVGTDIAAEDITEFYYTYSSSTYPPEYQRYRFYKEKEAYKFFHENREGYDWPLTEAHIKLSDSIELSEKEWTEFLNYLNGGKVKERNQSFEAGRSGPWLYLYWEGDRAKYQEFCFPTLHEEKAFENFCAELVKLNREQSEKCF